MRADFYDRLPSAGIVDREELEARRYRGMNPAFVRKVWAARREQKPRRDSVSMWTPERKALLLEYIQAGLSQGRMALKFKTTRNAIAGAIRHDPVLRAAQQMKEPNQCGS